VSDYLGQVLSSFLATGAHFDNLTDRILGKEMPMRVIDNAEEELDSGEALFSHIQTDLETTAEEKASANDTVCVYMSTYNGERYLHRQLDTILGQVGVHVELHIRDDGSTDGTLGVLDEYERDNRNVRIYRGENLGPDRSFNWLSCNVVTDAPYFAFADQDDIWDANKLSIATQHIRKEEAAYPDRPILYCGTSQLVDSNENLIRKDMGIKKGAGKHALLARGANGHTMTYNARLNNLIGCHCPFEPGYSYDSYAVSLACFLGEAIFDNRPHQMWRKHSASVSSASHSVRFAESVLIKGVRMTLRRLTYPHRNRYELLAKEILGIFPEKLDPSNMDKLLLVATYRQSLAKRFRLLGDREFLAGLTPHHRLWFRTLVLCGAF
jgi:rhamnosyltransferase